MTKRTKAQLDALYADNTSGNISAQDGRDLIDSVHADVGYGSSNAVTAAELKNIVDNGLKNIIEDTTPQLGGNLDVNGKSISGATHSDFEKLSELSATSTELNYVDGVTSAIQTQINAKANDDDVVHDTGNETITGVKTFSSFPITPSNAPSSNYQVANKKYVDDNSGGSSDDTARAYIQSKKIMDWIPNFTPDGIYTNTGLMGSGIVESEKYIFLCFNYDDYKYQKLVRFNKGTNRIDTFRITTTNAYGSDGHKSPAMLMTKSGVLIVAIEQLPSNSNHNSIIDIFRYTDLDNISDDQSPTTNVGNVTTQRLCYPYLFEMTNGDIFLETRKFDGSRYDERIYSKSTNVGVTFGTVTDYIEYGDTNIWAYAEKLTQNAKDRSNIIIAMLPQKSTDKAYQYVSFIKTSDFVTFYSLTGTNFGSSVTGSELMAAHSWGDTTLNTNNFVVGTPRIIDGEIVFVGRKGTRISGTSYYTYLEVVKVNVDTGAVTTGSDISFPFTATSGCYTYPFKIGDDLYFLAFHSTGQRVYKVASDLNSITLIDTFDDTYNLIMVNNSYTDLLTLYNNTKNQVEVYKL